jgi:hypothetical protein
MSVAFIYFVPQQYRLKYGLQSDKVKGEISITCDAWQANNVDGYFVVTGHWIEESSPGVWTLQEIYAAQQCSPWDPSRAGFIQNCQAHRN